MKSINYRIKILVSTLMVGIFSPGYAIGISGWDTAPQATLAYWRNQFSLPFSAPQATPINKTYSATGQLRETYNLPNTSPIFGLQFSGSFQLNTDTSVVRLLLVDSNGNERLVYETYPLSVGNRFYAVTNVCEETCFLPATQGQSLRIELIDASVYIGSLSYQSFAPALGQSLESVATTIKRAQNSVKIPALNAQIRAQGMKWVAGETSVSSLPYSEKKKRFGMLSNKVQNLQGMEYYKGGIFELRSANSTPAQTNTSSLTNSFDWRNRQGADRPNSPYYDNDPTFSGWITSIKDQDTCGSCWAFGATGATEALTNLYFNQHLDLDLAEQDALSCSGGGSCSGGWPPDALDFYTTNGVVDEACFPYTATDEICSNKCSNPKERITINGKIDFPPPNQQQTDDVLKQMIIDYGPLSGGIYSFGHAMTLVGYDLDPDDSRTIWIFKNSWGPGYGKNGYLFIKLDIADIGGTSALLTPIQSATPHTPRCLDDDKDGYYQWGISPTKPTSCPIAAIQKDCDDSNPGLGAFESDGSCKVLGKNDQYLMVADQKTTLDMYFSNENGTFQSPIAVGNYAGAVLSLYSSYVEANYAEMAVADFDGDDQLDFIAATNENPSRLFLYRRTGSYSYAPEPLGFLDPDPKAAYWLDPTKGNKPELAPDYGMGLIAADLDRDGDTDLIEGVNHDFGNNLFWIAQGNAYLNDGTGHFTKVSGAFNFSNIWNGWTLGMTSTLMDVTGDDFADMLVSNQSSGSAVNSQVYLLKGKGDGKFDTPKLVFTTANSPATFISMGDVNNDGREDALVGMDDDGDPGQVYWYFGYGNGTFAQTPREAFDTQPTIEFGSDQPGGGKFQVYDADLDGVVDIIASASINGPVTNGQDSAELLFFHGLGNGSFNEKRAIQSSIITNTAFTAPLMQSSAINILGSRNGDIDRNGNVDTDDIKILSQSNGSAVSINDPWDINGDRKINVLDARKIVSLGLCTKKLCAKP